MRLKNKSVKITELHQQIKKTIPFLDVLHKELTQQELVITSGKDGVHSTGSYHYTGKAYDFRRWAFDDLDSKSKALFISGLDVIFPTKYFDVVLESDHFHCEWDPQPIKDIPDPRITTDATRPTKREQPTKAGTPEIKVPFYKKDKFKRKLGAVVGAIGLICSIIPEPTVQVIGNIITTLGGGTLIAGAGHGMVKNRQKGEETKIDTIAILRWVADLLIRLFTKKGESK